MTNAQEQTVFVVDDDAAVRDSIEELVGSVGLHSEGYSSAFAFLDAFQPQRAGCLVLDVRMAAMSGLVLQERLNELGARIPVIVLTGHGDVLTVSRPCWIASTPHYPWTLPPGDRGRPRTTLKAASPR